MSRPDGRLGEGAVSEERAIAAFRAYVASLPVADRLPVGVAGVDGGGSPSRGGWRWVVPLAVAAAVVLVAMLSVGLGGLRSATPPVSSGEQRPTLPDRIASASFFTSPMRPGTLERGMLTYQHGHAVEFMDVPQFLVLSADGDVYRRVREVEDRADSDGDFPTTRLSPDGRRLAIGEHDEVPDDGLPNTVEMLDLASGEQVSYQVPGTRSGVTPVAWSPDGQVLWVFVAAERLGPNRVRCPLARLDLDTGEVALADRPRLVCRQDGFGSAPYGWVAPSPDGLHIVVGARDGRELVLDARTLDVVATWELPGDLVTRGWSPDGARILTQDGPRILMVHPLDGLELGQPTTITLPDESGVRGSMCCREEFGPLLGWDSPTTPILGRNLGTGGLPTSLVAIDLAEKSVRTLSRLDSTWTGAGITGVSMATGLAADLTVRPAGPPDRGPRRQWFLGTAATLVLGLVLLRWRRRLSVGRDGSRGGPGAPAGRGPAAASGSPPAPPVVPPGEPGPAGS